MKIRWTLNLQHFADKEPKEPETKQPETKEPETKEPETKEPESKEPETKEPETKETEPNPPTSSNKSGSAEEVEQLTRLVKLHGETTQATHEAMNRMRQELAETQEELRETTALLQNLIGQMDEVTDKVVTSAAALVHLHKAQSSKKED